MNPTIILGWLKARWKYVAIGVAVLLFLIIAGNFTLTRNIRAEAYSLGTYPGERLYTYYYRYPVILVHPPRSLDVGESLKQGQLVTRIEAQEIQKYCAKNYEVGIGYTQKKIEAYREKICEDGFELGDIMNLETSELEAYAPEIISVNAYGSYLQGYVQLQCDALDRRQFYILNKDGEPEHLRGNVLWMGNTERDDSIGYPDRATCEAKAAEGQQCGELLLRNHILENELKKYPELHETVLKNSIKSLDGYVRLFCDS